MLDKWLVKFSIIDLSLYSIGAAIIASAAALLYSLFKNFFKWGGKELYKSVIAEAKELLVTPDLEEIKQNISKIQKNVLQLTGKFKKYQEEKHDLEGEHKQVVQVIINDDHELRETLKDHYSKKQTKKDL